MTYRACQVCERHDRQEIELAYMTGERYAFPFARGVIERHMAHVTEPEALKIALGLSSATALAARLRHLEAQATTILDRAMTQNDKGQLANPVLALKAMREVRATMELMGRVAGTLIDRVQVDNARPDIDAAIADALAAKGFVGQHDPAEDPPAASAEDIYPAMRELPPGREETSEEVP